MITRPDGIGCTRDPLLRQRLDAYVKIKVEMHWFDSAEEALRAMEDRQAALLLLDLRCPDALELIPAASSRQPACPVICLAEPRSRPALAAEQAGVYAMQSLEPERRAFQSLVQNACDWTALKSSHSTLEKKLQQSEFLAESKEEFGTSGAPWRVSEVSRAFRCLDRSDELLLHIAGLAAAEIAASHLAFFLQDRGSGTFSIKGQIRHPHSTRMPALTLDDPAVHWMATQAQIISRRLVRDETRSSLRTALAKLLDRLHAEALVPLFSNGDFLGWLAIGGRSTGEEFSKRELAKLMELAQEIVTPIEKALLYEKANLNRHMLQRLFDALPTAMVAVNESRKILWLNQATEALFEASFDSALGQPSTILGEEFGTFVEAVLTGKGRAVQRTQLPSGLPVEFRSEALAEPQGALQGVLVLITDLSSEQELVKEKEMRIRSELLGEMTDRMAFEIRTPLTAIKAFTQLLPTRSSDKGFCEKFDQIVTHEIDRLTELSETLSTVGRLRSGGPQPAKTCVQINELVDLVRCLSGELWKGIDSQVEESLPPLEGNAERLAEGLCHLIANACDANQAKVTRVGFKASRVRVAKHVEAIEFTVSDNRQVLKVGDFVDNSSLGCVDTMKRADLRLSFACDIVREHAGSMELTTAPEGVTIKVKIPITV